MRNIKNQIGFIALAAIIAISMAACDNGSGAFSKTPGAGDYTFGNLVQTEGNVTAVTITPKQGKSPGDVYNIRYNNVYEIPQNIGTYAVTFDVAAAGGWNAASGLPAGTLAVNAKSPGAAVNAPTGVSTYTTITINAVAAPSNGQTVEYGISASNDAPAYGWQDGLSFSGLTGNNTPYYVFARSKEDATHNAGTPSAALSVSTKAQNTPYIINYGSVSSLSITIGGAPVFSWGGNISSVLDAIRADADGDPVTIQFGTAGYGGITITSSYNNLLEFSGDGWGPITLTGKIESYSSSYYTITIRDAVSVTSMADITNNVIDSNINGAILHSSTGTLNITGGTVKAVGTGIAVNAHSGLVTVSGTANITSENASSNSAQASSGTIRVGGTLDIQGGTVTNTASTYGNAVYIYRDSTGGVNISGGTVSATGGNSAAVYNPSTCAVNISGGTVSAAYGFAVYNTVQYNSGPGTVNISGGTVSTATGYAVHNTGSGTVNILGGEVKATTGTAVVNYTGTVTIPGGTVSATSGTAVFHYSTDYNSPVTLTISGGTVSATSGTAVHNPGHGTVNISDGTVSAIDGYAVHNTGYGTVNILGGEVKATTGIAVYNHPSEGVYSPGGEVNISGGTVSATTGIAVYNSFGYHTAGVITVSGSPLITSENSDTGTVRLPDTSSTPVLILPANWADLIKNTASLGNVIYPTTAVSDPNVVTVGP